MILRILGIILSGGSSNLLCLGALFQANLPRQGGRALYSARIVYGPWALGSEEINDKADT